MSQGAQKKDGEPTIQPGYFVSSRLGELAEKVIQASTKWKTVGDHLGVPAWEMPQGDEVDVQECFRKMLQHSLNNPPGGAWPYKRRILWKAVDSVNHALGKDLREEYDNDDILGSEHLGKLLTDLRKLEKSWKLLGEKLEIPKHKLDTFCPLDDCKQKFKEVLCTWMDQKADEATLTALYEALMAADFETLAKTIINDKDVLDLLICTDDSTQQTKQKATEKQLTDEEKLQLTLTNQNLNPEEFN